MRKLVANVREMAGSAIIRAEGSAPGKSGCFRGALSRRCYLNYDFVCSQILFSGSPKHHDKLPNLKHI